MQSIEPFSPQIQFHLLRHFNQPSQSYLQKLSQELALPLEALYKQFQLPASKFNTAFAETPLQLYNRIREAKATQFSIRFEDPVTAKKDYVGMFDPEHWPAGIGEDAVMPAETLNSSVVDSIRLQQRDDLFVQTLQVPRLPKTFQMVLAVSGDGQLITAFPGRWLPPLNENMVKNWIFLTRQ